MIDEPQPISKEPVVGDLVKTTPYSEVTATLEVLDRWGVERKHLAKLRRASSYVQSMVAKAIIQSDEKFFMGEAPAHPRVPLRFLDRTVSVTMDLAKTAAQLIADGTYDWVNSDIATRFSIQPEEGIRTAEVHLLHYNKRMTSDQVIADMDRQGLRPATFLELLWIGIQHPLLQLDFPIIALGTVVRVAGNRLVAYLHWSDRERGLDLSWLGLEWLEYDRFVAVRK